MELAFLRRQDYSQPIIRSARTPNCKAYKENKKTEGGKKTTAEKEQVPSKEEDVTLASNQVKCMQFGTDLCHKK